MRQSNRLRRFCLVFLTATWGFSAAAEPPEVRLISGFPFAAGDAANGESSATAVTADGRFVVVVSEANNLADGLYDSNGMMDVFVLDRQSGSFDLVTRDPAKPTRAALDYDPLVVGRTTSGGPISADGRFVAYRSSVRTLIAGSTHPNSSARQIYLFDRATGVTTLVSHAPGDDHLAGNGESTVAGLSADGRFVVFTSGAPSLTGGAADAQVFLYDRTTGLNQMVSHAAANPLAAANDSSQATAISADGRFVLFTSQATDLVAGQVDGANTDDVFVYDRQTGVVELISHDAANPLATARGTARTLSPDGRYVLLDSPTVAMAPGLTDLNSSGTDTFVFDRQSGTARLASVAALLSGQGANASATAQGMSADGQLVYFRSAASNLVAPFTDNNGAGQDLYLFSVNTGATTLVSHTAGDPAATGNGAVVLNPSSNGVSADGRWVSFATLAGDLDAAASDANGVADVYRFDLLAGTSALVSRSGATNIAGGADGLSAAVFTDAAGGVVFHGRSSLDPAAADPYSQRGIHRFEAAASALLTRAAGSGRTARPNSVASTTLPPTLSPNGRWTLWTRYLWDNRVGELELVSHAAGAPSSPADGASTARQISADGRFVLLTSWAGNIAAGFVDGNASGSDVFLYDRNVDAAFLMSRALGEANVSANGGSTAAWMSADAGKIILESQAGNLDASEGPRIPENLFLLDRGTGAYRLLSHSHLSPSVPADRSAYFLAAGEGPGWLVYTSSAFNLVPGFVDHNDIPDPEDTIYLSDLYYYDLLTGATTLLTHRAGAPSEGSSGETYQILATADGSSVFHSSTGSDLVAGQLPTNLGATKIYRWDRATDTNQLLFTRPGDPLDPCGGGDLAAISPNGRWVLGSTPCPLAASDTNSAYDAYLLDRTSGVYTLISHAPGDPATAIGGFGVAVSEDGRRITYQRSRSSYAYDRLSQKATLLSHAWDEPTGSEPVLGDAIQASADGSRVLLYTNGAGLTPFDPNDEYDVYLATLSDLFSDGFESGSTAAWSLTVPE